MLWEGVLVQPRVQNLFIENEAELYVLVTCILIILQFPVW